MHNCIISALIAAYYQIMTHWIPETHRVFLHHLLVVCHRCEPNDGDDRVQNKRKEEVFVQRDPLAAQTPTGGERHRDDKPISIHAKTNYPLRLTHLKWKNITREMKRDVSDSPCPMRAK